MKYAAGKLSAAYSLSIASENLSCRALRFRREKV